MTLNSYAVLIVDVVAIGLSTFALVRAKSMESRIAQMVRDLEAAQDHSARARPIIEGMLRENTLLRSLAGLPTEEHGHYNSDHCSKH